MLETFVRAIVHARWVATRGRILLAALIVIIPIIGIFLAINTATIGSKSTLSANPLQVSGVKSIQEICADIWSDGRKPYLSFENWCAANKPTGVRLVP